MLEVAGSKQYLLVHTLGGARSSHKINYVGIIMKKTVISLLITINMLGCSNMNKAENKQSINEPSTVNQLDSNTEKRQAFFESKYGKLPDDILKMADMVGSWAGGGLYKISATNLENNTFVYATSGLSNPQPSLKVQDSKVTYNEHGQIDEIQNKLVKNDVKQGSNNGYGYELIVISNDDAYYPLAILQVLVRMQINENINFLKHVEKYNGMTIGDIPTGNDTNESVDVFIQKAQAPLIDSYETEHGSVTILVATVITKDELDWSFKNGRPKLFEKIMSSPTKQASAIKRDSFVLMN